MLIFGLGRYREGSGVSAARFFVRHGARVIVTDLKTEKELRETVRILKRLVKEGKRSAVTLHLGGHNLRDVRWADLVMRNPGVPSSSPYLAEARRRRIPIMTDVSFFLQFCPCPVIGVTGTRGKSTTTALIGEMVRRVNKKTFVGGNIQRSPLNFLDTLDAGSVVVLELSSWLLESLSDTEQSPWAAVITNIYPDHLNIHRSMREYVAAKENIFRFQDRGGILVLNRNNPYTRRLNQHFHAVQHDSGPVWFSMRPLPARMAGAFVKDGWIVIRRQSRGRRWHEYRIIQMNRMALRGKHNIQNALAASALASAVRIAPKDICSVLRVFRGLPGRQEIVRARRGVTWVNDTTATIPEATIAALHRFGRVIASDRRERGNLARSPRRPDVVGTPRDDKKIILIAGGADKKLKFDALAREIKKYCKAVILLDGTATQKLKRILPTPYSLLPTAKSMREAVRRAQELAKRGDIVLLSPGAASFGLFQNEFDRGTQFVELVRRLK